MENNNVKINHLSCALNIKKKCILTGENLLNSGAMRIGYRVINTIDRTNIKLQR